MTPKQTRFVEEYLIDLNATQAAIRAGYSAKTAVVQGSRLLTNAKVAAAVARKQSERAERVGVTADEVLSRLWGTATADPNELIEFRRRCCRYCYGKDGRYQHTPAELEEKRSLWDARADKKATDVFDEQGGVGYDGKRPPNPDCPECFGDGIGVAFPKDTRALPRSAQLLYAGVKQTKEGLEIKMHDQQAASVHVGKHLGMFSDNLNLRAPDGPLAVAVTHRIVRPSAG